MQNFYKPIFLVLMLAVAGVAHGQRPVTFFHGLNRPSGDWYYAHQQLSQQFVYSPRLNGYNSSYSISTIAQQESSEILSNSLVVGHSLGGLVGREIVRQYGTGKVSALITAGSPHYGAEVTTHIDNGDLLYFIDLWTTDLAIGWYQLGFPFSIAGNVIQKAGVDLADDVRSGYSSGAALDLRPSSSFLQTLNSNPGATLPAAHYAIYGIEEGYPLPRLAGAFLTSNHQEGSAWTVYKGVAGLYFGMYILTARLGWLNYQDYQDTGDWYYYSASQYYYTSSNGFLRGLMALVDYIPREWHYSTTGTLEYVQNDGLLPVVTQAPSFVDPSRRLLSSQSNHQELLGHPNAINALVNAFRGVGIQEQ